MKIIHSEYEHNGFESGWLRLERHPVVDGDIRLIDGYLFRAYNVRERGLIIKRWEVLWIPMEPKAVTYPPRAFPFKPVEK